MLYKPKFCCNCGEKIERVEWNLLTSRRFCAVCADEQKKHDILPKALVGGGLLAFVFAVGTLMAGRGTEPVPLRTLKDSAPVGKTDPVVKKNVSEQLPAAPNQASNAAAAEISEQRPTEKNTSTGTVYFCSAATKKGSPCSRRVKAPGIRCWQHEGKTAMSEAN